MGFGGWGFAYVMKKGGPHENFRVFAVLAALRSFVYYHHCVNPYISFGVVFWGLFRVFHPFQQQEWILMKYFSVRRLI